jgi:hypothetical protein
MKKIVALVLCVVTVPCFAMNNDKKLLKERQTEALEFLATSHAMQTCMQIQERNEKNIIKYNQPSCLFLSTKFEELARKQSWK